MRFVLPAHSRSSRPVLLVLTAIAFTATARADVNSPGGEDKPGFIGRVLNPFGKKKEAPPAPPPPPVAEEKPKPATPGPKPKVTTIKPKSGGSSSKSTASKSSTGSSKKSSSSTAAKKTAPAKTETKEKESKPAAEPESKPVVAKTEAKKDSDASKPLEVTTPSTREGEFENDKDDHKAVTPSAPEIVTKLPSNSGWQIVKVGGRDYITGESLHQFYRFSSYKVDGKHVWLRSNNLIMKASIGSQELLINNIKFILSYPVLESGGRALFSRLDLCKLIDPIVRPQYINDSNYFDTVVIDAGHGGHDAGARGVYGFEKDFALSIAQQLRESLTRRGFKVLLTRDTDRFITLSGRAAIANATPNSIYISIHLNSGGSAASGIETFALTPAGASASLERGGGYNSGLTGNQHDSCNIALATAVHASVLSAVNGSPQGITLAGQRFSMIDRGVKRAQWTVLSGCKRPGILFEAGFVTNPKEGALIGSKSYQKFMAECIALGVMNYRKALSSTVTKSR
ncbi:MAG TPA: N-acetylmuramoyl-L-alanine amidase [Prosthecobacter sp.]